MKPRIILPKTRPEDDHDGLIRMQKDLLYWAEELYGGRDTSWNLAPQPMFGNRNPHIFYPDPASLKLVMIKLGQGAREKWTKALFQLAHEVIHLLNPNRPDPGECPVTNYLEEGVACAFSSYVQRRCGITGNDFVRDNLPAYIYALRLVTQLPKGNIAAARRIRREMPPGTPFSSVSKDDLLCIFPDLDLKHADALTNEFERDKTDFHRSF